MEAPGIFEETAFIYSALNSSSSPNLNHKYFLSWTAFAVLIVDLMLFNGFPSIWILTSWSKRESWGGKSLRSLLLTLSVFKFFKWKTSLGNSHILLLWRSRTVRLGQWWRFEIEEMKLKAKIRESKSKDFGISSKEVSLF